MPTLQKSANSRVSCGAKRLDGLLPRAANLAHVTTVPLLILDDLSMRKLPHTAAEDLLEIIMRRYEKASTLNHVEPARGRLGKAARRYRRRRGLPRPPASPRARAHLRPAELAHPPPGRSGATHDPAGPDRRASQRLQDRRSRVTRYLVSPEIGVFEGDDILAPPDDQPPAAADFVESGDDAVEHSHRLGRPPHWPVLTRPRLAGFQVSTEVFAKCVEVCASKGMPRLVYGKYIYGHRR